MWNYTDKVKEHFLHPKNVGIIDNPDGSGEVGSLACGDALKLTFKLNKEGKIEDAKFQTFGCASAIASSSALTEMLKGKTLEEADKITNKDIANYLGGLPKEKMHCSVMGQDALEKAISSFRGVEKSNKKRIICECSGVTEAEIITSIKEKKMSTVEEVTALLDAGGDCGGCHDKIRRIIDSTINDSSFLKQKKLTTVQKIRMIDAALEKEIKPALMQDGGDIDLVDVDGSSVFIKFKGACASCSKSQVTLKHYVENKLRELVSPDLNVEEA